MANKSTALSNARLLKRSVAKPRRDAWESTNAVADGLLLELVEFEQLVISFLDAGLMTRAVAKCFRKRASRSQREVVLCLRELAATDQADYAPADQVRFRESLGTWRAMKRIGLRTLRRLDAVLAEK
jgi:hypothetical protein